MSKELPKGLEELCAEQADAYDDYQLNPDVERAFAAGFEACYSALLSMGGEFDEHVVERFIDEPKGNWLSKEGIAFVDGARWMHQQSQAQIALFKDHAKCAYAAIEIATKRIAELEAELEQRRLNEQGHLEVIACQAKEIDELEAEVAELTELNLMLMGRGL